MVFIIRGWTRTGGLPLRHAARPEALEVHVQAQHLLRVHDVRGPHREGGEAPAHARVSGAGRSVGAGDDEGGHLGGHVLHRERDHLAQPDEAVPGAAVLRDGREGPTVAAAGGARGSGLLLGLGGGLFL